MKLKKGSAAAKAYMAKIRAKRKGVKKVGEVAKTKTGKPAKRFNKAQREYNKDVDAYKYFVVVDGRVTEGYEFKSDAMDAANEYEPKGKILTKQGLKQAGITNPSSEWKYTLGATKKVGSTLKLKANEKRLGATPKDAKTNSKNYHKDTKSHNVNISVVSGFNELTAKQKTLYNKLDTVYNKNGLFKIVSFETYIMQNIVIAEAKRKSTTDLYKIYEFVQNDY